MFHGTRPLDRRCMVSWTREAPSLAAGPEGCEPRGALRRLRCVIIEDHRMFLDLVTTMLRAAPGLAIDVVGSAGSVADGIAACDRLEPDVVLLDLALPDGKGIEVAEHVAATRPAAKIVVISGQADTLVCPADLARCTHAVVHKSEAFDALQAILADIARECRDATVANKRRARMADRGQVELLLSQREREILALLGDSLTSNEIAIRLRLSAHTVQSHRKNIAIKLGIPGRMLAAEAYRFRNRLDGGQ